MYPWQQLQLDGSSKQSQSPVDHCPSWGFANGGAEAGGGRTDLA